MLGLKQQATTLLPKNLTTEKLCQVANLVRTKTTATLQQRFNFRPAATAVTTAAHKRPPTMVTNHNKNVDHNGDQTIPMEVMSSPGDERSAALPTMSATMTVVVDANGAGANVTETVLVQTPVALDRSLIRSQTFDLQHSDIMNDAGGASPQHSGVSTTPNIADALATTRTIASPTLQGTFVTQTSSPNLNATQTLKRFSFGESMILDTSSAVLGLSPSIENLSPSDATSTTTAMQTPQSDASHATGLLRAKMKQSVQNRLDGTFTASTPNGCLSMGNCSQVSPARDATIAVNAKPRILDATATLSNPWNVTETLAAHQSQQHSNTLESENATLMAMSVEHERMEFDDGMNGEWNHRFTNCVVVFSTDHYSSPIAQA